MEIKEKLPLRATFHIHTALHEESTSGWIWGTRHIEARRLIEIKNPQSKRSVICEYRRIDQYFDAHYNDQRPQRSQTLQLNENALIISFWYRRVLQIGEPPVLQELEFQHPKNRYLAGIRAGCQHPDHIVRLATKLGVLGAWLGVVGIAVGVLSLKPESCLVLGTVLAVIVLTAGFCFWIAREPD